MKKTLCLLSAAAMLLGMVSCSKETKCKCVYTDYPMETNELNILFVEGIACEDITEMAYERPVSTPDGNTLERTDVRKVNCSEYGH